MTELIEQYGSVMLFSIIGLTVIGCLYSVFTIVA